MKNKCGRPKDPAYKYYGAKGIKVCDEWKRFIPFYEWTKANGYTEGMWISRIDKKGDFSPANCVIRGRNEKRK